MFVIHVDFEYVLIAWGNIVVLMAQAINVVNVDGAK